MPKKYTMDNINKEDVFKKAAIVIEQWQTVVQTNNVVNYEDKIMALAISCILFAWNNPPE